MCIRINNSLSEWRQQMCPYFLKIERKRNRMYQDSHTFIETTRDSLELPEEQLHSWNNNVLKFCTSPEGFPGTNWNLLTKQAQKRQKLFWNLFFFWQNSLRLFNITYSFLPPKNQTAKSIFQDFRKLFWLAILTEFCSIWIIWTSRTQALDLDTMRMHSCTYTKSDLLALCEVRIYPWLWRTSARCSELGEVAMCTISQ